MVAERGGITLALGGLGMRGALNIGVLQAANQLGIQVKGLRATGISTMISAYYALGRDPADLIPRFISFFQDNRRLLWGLEAYGGLPSGQKLTAARSLAYFLRESLFCRNNFSRVSVFPWDQVLPRVSELFGKTETADLKVPLAVGVVDLEAGRERVLRRGRLVDLVLAGIAYPGLFPPLRLGGKLYVNSILLRKVPLAELSAEERPVVAVISQPARLGYRRPRSLLEVLSRSDELRTRALTDLGLREADAVVKLTGLERFSWSRVRDLERFVATVREQALDAFSRLKLPSASEPS